MSGRAAKTIRRLVTLRMLRLVQRGLTPGSALYHEAKEAELRAVRRSWSAASPRTRGAWRKRIDREVSRLRQASRSAGSDGGAEGSAPI